MNLPYLVPRLVRHFLPQPMVRFLLQRQWFVRPGQETSDPQAALRRYRQVLESHHVSWEGKDILVFGYGGHFAFACGLLESGARHVILCDKDAPPDHFRNTALWPRYAKYLVHDGRTVLPRQERITLLQGDIRDVTIAGKIAPVDLVLSSSVFEHLDDVNGITRRLAELTRPEGMQVHFIDLRDHFFRYPFEMLCYSEKIWRNWLNPGSNHNRYRFTDYLRVFERYFENVTIEVVAKDQAAFQAVYPRIRPEFLTGDIEIDSITLIQVIAGSPRRNGKQDWEDR